MTMYSELLKENNNLKVALDDLVQQRDEAIRRSRMTEPKLSAAKALDDAADWLRSAEKLWNADDDRAQAMAASDMANAYSAYAQAWTLWHSEVTVRKAGE